MIAGWYPTVQSEKNPQMCGAECGISGVAAEHMIPHLGRDAGIWCIFTGTRKAVWKQCLGRNYSASLNADAQDPELPSGLDLPLVCVINPIRCVMSSALKEPRNEGLSPKQWILFFKETIYISFLLKNQRKISRFYRSCKIAAPPP